MPGKRSTRARAASKGKLPDATMAAEVLESHQRQQLQMYLDDFNSRVKTILKDLEKSKASMVLKIQRTTAAQVTNVPWIPQKPQSSVFVDPKKAQSPQLHHLTVKEFAAAGGPIDNAVEYVRRQKQSSVESSLQRIEALTWTAPPITTIQEEASEGVDASKTAVQEFRTARPKRAIKSRLMKTPAITPKFNPDLPITPENIRDERPGERLISMAGTPVRRTFQEDRQALESNLATIGLNLTPKTMGRLIDTVASSVTSFRK